MKRIVLLILVLLFLASCAPSQKQIEEAIQKTNVAAGQVTVKALVPTTIPTDALPLTSTTTSKPTETIAPTNTPENTSTPTVAPTETPPPTETPVPSAIVFTGSSDKIIDIPEGISFSFVDLTYKGNSNFIVIQLDSNNKRITSLVNKIGNYSGRHSIGFFYDTPKRLQVKAQGEWTITFNPLDKSYFHICNIPGTCSGKGDDVVVFDARPDTGEFEHNGQSNFIVRAAADSPQSIINEIGAYKGEVIFPSGTRFVEIIADGEWTMTITTN